MADRAAGAAAVAPHRPAAAVARRVRRVCYPAGDSNRPGDRSKNAGHSVLHILRGDAMDCCGHAVTRRWWMWGSVMASVGAMVGGGVGRRAGAAAAETADAAPAALEVLRKSISVDVHTHGGTTGITSQAPPSDDLAQGMRAGSLATACLADVPDGPILGRNAAGVLGVVRTAEPGMLYRYHLGRLDWMEARAARGGAPARRQARAARALHAERHRRLPDRHGHP